MIILMANGVKVVSAASAVWGDSALFGNTAAGTALKSNVLIGGEK